MCSSDLDLLYDEIGSVLKVKQIQRERQELLEALELYYRIFILGKSPQEAGIEIEE